VKAAIRVINPRPESGDRSMRLPSVPSRSHRSRRLLFTVCLGGTAFAAACGIALRRDYATIPPGQVGFDDMCGLQDYFDTIEAKQAAAPTLVSAVDTENQANARLQGGKNRFSFETDFQLKQLRRTLDDNWKNLPESLAKAERVEIEVHWSAKAGVQRVVTESDAELIVGRESFALPYQVCLSELLFGAPLYRQRRLLAGRMLPNKPLLGEGGGKVENTDAGTASTALAASAPAAATTAAAGATTTAATPAALTTTTPTPTPTVRAPAVAPAPAAAAAPAAPAPAAAEAAPARPVFKQAPPAQ
jgi:hypothetical protein